MDFTVHDGSMGSGMTPSPDDERQLVRAELRQLCRGRGLQAAELHLGPALAARYSAEFGAGPVDRGQLLEWIRHKLNALPADLRRAASIGLGMHPDADNRFLGARLDHL